jgi:uncharacterized protein
MEGAAVDGYDDRGFTALHAAAATGTVDLIRLLVQHGAGLDVQARRGVTPLVLAVMRGNREIVESLLGYEADPRIGNPLHIAVKWNQAGIVEDLLKLNVDVNGTDEAGKVPLAYALDSADMVRLLLSHGADASKRMGDGRTVREMATDTENKEIIDLLAIPPTHEGISFSNAGGQECQSRF